MKILIVGDKGVLGRNLKDVLQKEHEVIGYDKEEMDITDFDYVSDKIRQIKPNIIINSAGYCNIDLCEQNVELAYKTNVLGVTSLAILCKELNIPIVQISSDYIFDGSSNKPYNELSIPNPRNIYGKTKLCAENMIKSLTTRYYIVRTAYLFGTNGNNHLAKIINQLIDDEVVRVVNDQFMNPTYVNDLAKVISQLISKPLYGTYHIVNDGYCSRYEFALEILKHLNLNKEIIPMKLRDAQKPAKRPAFTSLSTLNNYTMRNWKDALEEIFETNSIVSLRGKELCKIS